MELCTIRGYDRMWYPHQSKIEETKKKDIVYKTIEKETEIDEEPVQEEVEKNV